MACSSEYVISVEQERLQNLRKKQPACVRFNLKFKQGDAVRWTQPFIIRRETSEWKHHG